MPNLTDVKVIRDLCARYDFALSKGFGQNFIVNPGICPRMVEAAGIDESFGVLEIGPGIGVLTKELAARAAKVVAVEVDERLPPLLAETLADCPNVKIVMGDVLKVDLTKLIAEEFAGLKVAVCANLPYYITSPIVMTPAGRAAAGGAHHRDGAEGGGRADQRRPGQPAPPEPSATAWPITPSPACCSPCSRAASSRRRR